MVTVTKSRLFRTALIMSFIIVLFYWNITYSRDQVVCTTQQTGDYVEKGGRQYTIQGKKNLEHSETLHEILKSYQHQHAVQRRVLAGGGKSNTLTWYCVQDCSGIGDRIKGMYQAFLLALITNRTFFILQGDEIAKTMFIEPNKINWKPVERCTTLKSHQTIHKFDHPNIIQQMVLGTTNNFSSHFRRLNSNFDAIFLSGMSGAYTFIQKINSSYIANQNPPLFRLILQNLSKLTGEHYLISTIYHYLFSITNQVERMASLSLRELMLQPHGFVSVHIRTGFKSSFIGEIVPFSKEFYAGNRFARSQDSWRRMMECAFDIADSKFGQNSTILIVSDDKEPKSWAAAEYKSRVTMLDIKPVHVDFGNGYSRYLGVGMSDSSDAYMQTWVELSILSQSAAIVSIPSGFSEVASYAGFIDPLFLYHYTLSNKKCAHVCMHCS